jgi:hypothetical protein
LFRTAGTKTNCFHFREPIYDKDNICEDKDNICMRDVLRKGICVISNHDIDRSIDRSNLCGGADITSVLQYFINSSILNLQHGLYSYTDRPEKFRHISKKKHIQKNNFNNFNNKDIII